MSNVRSEIKQSLLSRTWWLDMVKIFVGCSILSMAFVLFINPYNIVPGGVYGASIVLHSIFPSIKVGTFGYMFDVPLLCLSFIAFGNSLGGRTIFAALLTPAIMNLMTEWCYPPEAVESLERMDRQRSRRTLFLCLRQKQLSAQQTPISREEPKRQ